MGDWGFTNTPIVFTNSISLGMCYDGIWDWMVKEYAEKGIDISRNYGTPVVGETCDWLVNCDLATNRIGKENVVQAFEAAKTAEEGGTVKEGSEGGGAGMTCHQFAGGTGTASRLLKGENGREYVLGVLVQTNYGHLRDLRIGGVPIGKIFQKEKDKPEVRKEDMLIGGKVSDGSIVVAIITNAPLLPHQLNRLARHATAGLAQVGSYGIGRTHSGDIFIASSTAEHPQEHVEGVEFGYFNEAQTYKVDVLKNESIDAFSVAATEATEEAILNSLVGSREGIIAQDGTVIDGLPVHRVQALLQKHLVET